MSRKDKIGKVNLTKGTSGRLIGAMGGGACNALWDKYVTPELPESLAVYPDYVKIGVGVVLPMLVKNNDIVNAVSDSLISSGTSNIVTGMLADDTEKEEGVEGVPSSIFAVGRSRRRIVPGGAPFRGAYAKAVKLSGSQASTVAVSKAKRQRIVG